MIISMIVAVAENGVIGKNNDLAWHLPDDMRYFKKTTKGKPVIMGRKNWESIPHKWQPLPGRKNIIITRQGDYTANGATIVDSLEKAIAEAKKDDLEEIFIIGGGEIYAMGLEIADRMYITEIQGSPAGDTYFPEWDKSHWDETSRVHHPTDEKHAFAFDYVVYDRK